MQSSKVRATLLGGVSTAAAIFLLPADAQAQATTCSQSGSTITCVDGTSTVLTASGTNTTTFPTPGLVVQNNSANEAATVSYTATGPITTTAAPGIQLFSTTGPVTLTPAGTGAAVNVSTIGGVDADAIFLNTPGQAATITVGNLSTTGVRSYGVFAVAGTDLTLRTGNVSTSGATANGVDANGQSGTVAITTGNISAAGAGLSAFTSNGPVTVVTGNVIAGTQGVNVEGASASVTTGNVTAANGLGVAAISNTGNVTIQTGTVSAANGTGLGGIGIGGLARSATGSVTIGGCSNVSSTGAQSPAVGAQTLGTGAISITCGAVSTTGVGGAGVIADSAGGNIAITTTSATTSGLGAYGLTARTQGTGTVTTNAGAISVTGDGSTGLFVRANTGAVNAGYGNITTSGAGAAGNTANALDIQSNGTIALRGSGATLRTNGAGVAAAVISGNGVTGNLGNVTTTGAGSQGAVITSTAPINLTIGTVATTGNGVTLNAGANAVTLTSGAVTATGSGATGTVINSTGAVTFNGGRQAANGANALRINGGAGAVTATTAGAAVTSTGGAVVLTGTGPLTFTDTGTISTTGSNSDAVTLTTTGGPIVITTNQVTTTGGAGSRGIVANAGGNVTITAAGTTTTGEGASAIVANSTAGAVNATLSGTTSSLSQNGVLLQAGTTAALTVSSGTLFGVNTGATISSGTGTTVTNAGTIGGQIFALAVAGGAATVANSGTINGRILLTGNNDTVTNTGTFNATAVSDFGAGNDTFTNSGTFNANANTDFGAGTDVFNNSGTLRVLTTATAPGTIAFANLETLNNSNLIDLRNGRTGDVFSTSGAYVGSGNATIGLNAALGTTSTADQVRIGGAATGSTNVQLNLTRTGVAVLSNANGITLVQAGSGSSANAFTLNSALVDQGLVQYGIAYNPTTFAFNLVATPAAAVYRNLLSAASVRNLWLQSADAWTGHMRELRDNIAANGAGGAGGRFWVQALGQVEERRGLRSFSFNGLTTPTNLGYKQDYFGGQVGLDIGGGGAEGEGGFAFGVTGGYLNSTLNFANSADRINYDAINGGVYASLDSGIFFVNLLGKYDYYWSNNRTNFYNVDAEGSVYGARGEVGLRLGERVWFEPAASLSYTHSDFDDIATAQGNFTFDDADGLRGKGGARLGFTTNVGPSKATLYAGGNYVREFRGRDRVAFVSGGQTVNFQNLRARDYGEGIVGLNVGSDQGRVSGFFEGRYANGGDYEGYGGRAGMRLRF